MASIVLKSLSVLLGIFFIFVGTTKLTPKVSKELHKDLRREFARYSKVFPLSQTLEFKIPSKWYRRTVGGLEVLCGFCLTFIPSKRIKQAANLILVVMMMFATYNHWMVGDKFERIAPSLVFFFMLTCRLIVEYQTKRKEKTDKQAVDKAAAGKAANASGTNAENNANANNANNVSVNDAKSKED
ncbi:putative acetylcholine receptor chaperone [Oratosquilla oratoria]|uniref:putative acetylcholine receptor chaperone n=1 Tax=Oratosquilla oratoria TaxID=337810 RepID=UPI003F76907B